MNASSSDCRPACAGGFIGSIVVNALLLYFAHHLLDWQIPWIRSTWSGALWAIDLSLGVSIFVNVLHLAVDARWFRNLVGSLSCGAVAVATWWVYTVFPFDLGSAQADDFGRVILLLLLEATLIGMFATAILGLVELAAALIGRHGCHGRENPHLSPRNPTTSKAVAASRWQVQQLVVVGIRRRLKHFRDLLGDCVFCR